MNLSDFTFTVGYNGAEAIVNKEVSGTFSNPSVKDLADNGQFKSALCCALYNKDSDGIQYIIDTYNKISGSDYKTEAQIKRLFGVFSVPDNVNRIKKL